MKEKPLPETLEKAHAEIERLRSLVYRYNLCAVKNPAVKMGYFWSIPFLDKTLPMGLAELGTTLV